MLAGDQPAPQRRAGQVHDGLAQVRQRPVLVAQPRRRPEQRRVHLQVGVLHDLLAAAEIVDEQCREPQQAAVFGDIERREGFLGGCMDAVDEVVAVDAADAVPAADSRSAGGSPRPLGSPYRRVATGSTVGTNAGKRAVVASITFCQTPETSARLRPLVPLQPPGPSAGRTKFTRR